MSGRRLEPEVLPILGRPDCIGLAIAARRQALACGWSTRDGGELELIVVELATNAIRHAGSGTCRLEVGASRATVEVLDEGPGFPPWVLERHRRAQHLEGVVPHRLGGLGAGLDSCARLADQLTLENRKPRGARAYAVRRRRTPHDPEHVDE